MTTIVRLLEDRINLARLCGKTFCVCVAIQDAAALVRAPDPIIPPHFRLTAFRGTG